MNRFLLCVLLLINVGVTAQIVNIPDANFKNALLNYNPVIDTNGDGEIQESEAAVVIELFIVFEEIADATGIEAFTSLETLVMRNNLLTTIDVSNNVNLKVFHVETNNLTSVNMGGNPLLENVRLFQNNLTSVDVSTNPLLESLYVSANNLTELDLSQNPDLRSLVISANNFTEIDLSNNPQMEFLGLDNNKITTLDVSNFSSLGTLSFDNNLISEIDLSNNPDLGRLYMRNNKITELDVSNNPLLTELFASDNNIGQIDLSQNTALERLELNTCGLEELDLNQNIDIWQLQLRYNQLSSLNLSNNTALSSVYFDVNEISSLILPASAPIEFLFCGNNELDELDVTNFSGLRILQFDDNSISSIDISQNPILEQLYARNNNLVSINTTGNPNLSQLYLQFNPIANVDLSTNPSLNTLGIFNTNITELDLSNNPSMLGFSASNNFNLEYVNVKNGNNIDINTFELLNNPNLQFICVDDVAYAASNFAEVPVTSTFIDDCAIANGSINNIQGTVTYDDEGDGCDAGDFGLPNQLINTTDGTNNFAVSSDASGNYNLNVLEGTYTTTVLGLPPYYDVSPTEVVDTFTGFNQTEIADFCISPNTTANDLVVSMLPLNEARPGFDADYLLEYQNDGTTVLNGEVTLTFDDIRVNFVSANPTPTSTTTNTVTWDLGSLNPFDDGSIEITFNLFPPPVNESNDILSFVASIEPSIDDETPENNSYNLDQVVVNSQDPNDKLVAEGSEVLIEDSGDYLHYTVRFQNVGTASAINVRIQDELDELLDINSLRILSSSHPMEVTLLNRQIDFIFDGINLPSEAQDPEGSQGYVTFKIRPVSGIELGDTIENFADIYFDFNAPITTNTVSTTFVKELGIDDFQTNSIKIYPNPALSVVQIRSEFRMKQIEIFSVMGQRIFESMVNDTELIVDVTGLNRGNYFVRITTDSGVDVHQIVKK